MSRRAQSTSTAVSAISSWISWWPAITLPNCLRSVVYFTIVSRAAWASPVQDAPSDIRPSLSAVSATRMPLPSSPPSSASGPTLTSVSTSSAVSQDRRPSLPWIFLLANPGVSLGTRKALTPRAPGPPVRAMNSVTPAMVPLVMKILVPLST